MSRSNNPLRSCEYAKISWSLYEQWIAEGFITSEMLSDAASTFHSKHPNVDSLARHKPDDVVLGGLPSESSFAVHVHAPAITFGESVFEVRGYSEAEVLSPEGWTGDDDL